MTKFATMIKLIPNKRRGLLPKSFVIKKAEKILANSWIKLISNGV